MNIVKKLDYKKHIEDIFQDTLSYIVYKNNPELLKTLVPNFIGETPFQYAQFSSAEVDNYKYKIEKALAFMYECVEAFIEKDDLDLYKKMGFDNPQLIELIKLSWQAAQVKGLPEELVYGIYGNFDFVPDKEGGIKIYEYNGNTPVLTFESIVLQNCFIEDNGFASTSQYNNLSEVWQYMFKSVFKNHGVLNTVFAGCPELLNDVLTLETMAYSAQASGHDTFIADIKEDIDFDFMEQVFYKKDDDRPIDFMVNFFPWEDYDTYALDAFIKNYKNLIENGKGTIVAEPAFKILMSNKAFLSFMTDYDYDRMVECGFIPTYLDKTKLAGSKFIGKPVYGRMSSNIQFYENGVDMVNETEGAYSDTLFVYQPFIDMVKVNNDEDFYQYRMWVAPSEYEDGEFYFSSCGLAVRKSTSALSMNVETEEFIPHVIKD